MSVGGSGIARPPVIARGLLRLCLPPSEVESIPGDLEEEFAGLLAARGLPAAKRWYWAQVLRSFGPLLGYRLREQRVGRLLGAVVAGFLILQLPGGLVGALAMNLASTGDGSVGPGLRLMHLAAGFGGMVAGGYVASRVAGSEGRRSVALLTGVCLFLAIFAVATSSNGEPLWHTLAWLGLLPAGIFVGGRGDRWARGRASRSPRGE